MRIRSVKRSNRDENMFILEFQDQEDLDNLLKCFEYVYEDFPEDSFEYQALKNAQTKIQSRCDAKYAYGDVWQSATLFLDEFTLMSSALLRAEMLKAEYMRKYG